ncbi:MAG: hypothetical protein ACXVEF_33005 [Polyangiales bacterium]
MRLQSLFAVALFAVTGACSSSSSGPGATPSDGGGDETTTGDSGGTTVEQACDQYAQTICDKLSSCLGVFVNVAFGDVATCKSRYVPKCTDAFKATGTAAQPADLAACSDAAKTASCESLLDNNPPAACMPKKGSVANGTACGDDAQCSSGFCGFDDAKRVCGVCGGAPMAGATCADGKKCGQGFVCATNGKCAAPVAEGATCDDTIPCQAGLSCAGGKCAKKVATEGGACGGTSPDCDNAQGLFCVTNKCVKVTFVAEGTQCGLDIDTTTTPAKVKGVTLCNHGGWCKDFDAAKMKYKGTCTKAAADGEACGTDTVDPKNPPCLAPAICVTNKCTYPLASSCK